jgi:hypothetical protein
VTKGVGQEVMEKYFGSGQGPNWAVAPLVVVVVVFGALVPSHRNYRRRISHIFQIKG